MNKRPVIKLTLSPVDKFVELAGYVILIILWALTAFAIFNLHEIVPVHFNISGKPDRYGDRLTLIILPLIGTFVFALLTVLNKYPHIFNYIAPVTNENAEKQYRMATRMLRFLKLAIVLLFTAVVVLTYLTSKGFISELPAWGIVVPMVITVVTPIIFVVYQTKTAGKL